MKMIRRRYLFLLVVKLFTLQFTRTHGQIIFLTMKISQHKEVADTFLHSFNFTITFIILLSSCFLNLEICFVLQKRKGEFRIFIMSHYIQRQLRKRAKQ